MAPGKNKPAAPPLALITGAGLLFGLLLLVCTQSFAQSSEHKKWFLGFGAPAYMEVYIETADVVDIHERLLRRAVAGIASVQTPSNNKGKPAGWPQNPGSGAGHYISQVDLPRLIYVRWQSLAEPQTYEAYIVIPESAHEIMRKSEKVLCSFGAEWITESRNKVSIGLAPGGIVKVWLGGACLDAVEITRVVGTINKRGPSQGKNEGRYALPLSPESQAYIDKFGIPYGSW